MSLQVKSFLRHLKVEKGLSTNTVESYQRDIEDVQKFFHRNDISKISRDQLRNYWDTVKEKCTPRTVARRMSALRQFYGFLEREGTINDNPIDGIETPSFKTTLPKILSEAEVEQLIEKACEDKTEEGIRFAAMLEVLYATGMRVTELVTVLNENMTEYKGMHVVMVKGKGNKERMVPLNDKAWQRILEYMTIRNKFLKDKANPFLFASTSGKGHITRQRFAQRLKDTAIACNFDPEKVSPHVLRHAFATHMLRSGANLMLIKELLGHANLSTSEIYLHVLPEDLMSLVQEHHPLSVKKTG